MSNLRFFLITCSLLSFLVCSLQAQWVSSGSEISNKDLRTFAFSGSFVFAAGMNYSGAWRSADGMFWLLKTSGMGTNTSVRVLAVKGALIFAGTEFGGVFRSTDNGENWSAVTNGLGSSLHVYAMAVSGTTLFAGTYNATGGVFRSTDDGASWTAASNGLNSTYVRALAVHGSDLWVATLNTGIYVSTNNGTNWTPRNNGLSNPAEHSFAFIDPYVFVSTLGGGGVARSTDNGLSWTQVASWGDTSAYVLTVVGTSLFAGTAYGKVRRSTNYGTSWSDVSTGLPAFDVYALRVYGDYLLAATTGAGVWRRPLSQLVSVDEDRGGFPREYALQQNYPNPFNPTTTIGYQLPSRSRVTLKVFDILGREVATLTDAIEEPGYKEVRFDAVGLASGVYFYRLQAGDFVQTRKLLLLR